MPPTDHDPDDDQQWLDLLAGRSVGDPSLSTAQQAAWLRAALLAYRARAPEGGPAPPEQRIARLLARAQAAGLLPPAEQAPAARARALPRRWPAARWTWGGAALAAALALVVVPWALQRDAADDSGTVLRGAAVQTRSAADPAADREAVRAALQAVKLEAAPYQRLDRLGLDVELPSPLTPPQRETLLRLGLTPPAGPALRIEFVPNVPRQ